MSHHFSNNTTNTPIQYNGRVLLKGHEPKNVLNLYSQKPLEQHTSYNNALTGNWTNTPLSLAFFCAKNIEILQNGIRKGVYDMSNGQYLLGNQNDDVLKVIMRSTYLQFAKHNPNNSITNQIKQLNKLVIDYSVRQLYGETQGYLKYLQDASTLAVPMERPVMTKEYESLEMTYGF